MFKNKFFIFIILLIAMLSIGIASAGEASLNTTDTQEVVVGTYDDSNLNAGECISLEADNDVVGFEESGNNSQLQLNKNENVITESATGSFDDLKEAIGTKTDNSVLYLGCDYKYSEDSDFSGITISQNNFVIDGQGHKIDANAGSNDVRIFSITGNNVTLKNLILINAKVSDDGAAIFSSADKLSLSNCTFINNTADSGGAIYSSGDNSSIMGSTFSNNTAKSNGGAIYNDGSSAGANFMISDSNFTNNKANYGGVIYNYGYDWEDYICENFTINNCRFISNTARSAGVIYNDGGISFTVANSTCINNSVDGHGGVIYNSCPVYFWVPEPGRNFVVGNTTFINNSANRGGGAIYNNNADGFTISNSNFINNTGSMGGVIWTSGNSGGSGNFTISGSSFINNTGSWGGVLYNDRSVDFTLTNSSFTGNTGTWGGAINIYDGVNFTLTNSSFINNTADLGGAVLNDCVNSTISNCNFTNNTAKKKGADICNDNDEATLNLTDNTYSEVKDIANIYNNRGKIISPVSITVLEDKTIYVKIGDTVTLSATIITGDGASIAGETLNFIIDDLISAKSNANGTYTATYLVTSENIGKVVSASYDGQSDDVSVNPGTLETREIPDITVSADSVEYGKDLVITGTINKSIAGNLTIVLDGDKSYTADISNGKFTYIITDLLSAGDHNISVKYDGNDIYAPFEVTNTTNVAPITANLDISIANVTYGEFSTITVKLTGLNNTKLNGTVTITIDGDGYYVYVENGTGTSDKVKLPVNNYSFGSIWKSNNNNYTNTKVHGSFHVSKANLTMDVKADSVEIGQNVTVTVSGLGDATGNVTIKVNNEIYNLTIENGVATKEIANLDVANYTVDVNYAGDRNYNSSVASANFTVSKIATNIDFVAKNIHYGENATLIILNLPEDATGNLTIIFGDEKIIMDVVDEIFIPNLEAGNDTVTIKYGGDHKYLESSATRNILVDKLVSKLNVNIKDINYGEILDITATLTGVNNAPLNGIIKVEINGKTYSVEIKDGVCTYDNIKLPAGKYEFSASWEGNVNYTNATFNGKFNIAKINPTIKVDADNVKVEENTTVKVTLSEDATGNVTITVGGENYIVDVENGIATKNITINKADNYTVNVVYNGDNNYNTIKNSTNFIASKISNYNITIDTEDVFIGQNTTIKVTLPKDINEEITIVINNENYTVLAKGGIATINITDLASGYYNVLVNFENDKYAYKSANTTFQVFKISDYSINITVPEDIMENENATFTVNLPEDADGNLTFIINGKNYTGVAKNGTFNITISGLVIGEYNATVIYEGNDKYATVNDTVKVIVNKKSVVLTTNDVVMIYHDGSRLYATLLDAGNPIANTTLSFTINGITYNRTTDSNGTASIALNLEYGVYNVIIDYAGDEIYSSAIANSTVTINSSIVGSDILKMYQNDTQFYATFVDSNGKALANTNVTFNINGVFYERKTNENGTARLNINLNPGNYTLTAYNNVSGEQRGLNVLIKSLIETSDLTKYYKNESKFEAKVYNKDGSIAVNKSVTFNINGVFYTRTSDENGTVKLAINLDSGNYTVTTIYEGLSIGNNVEVKPIIETADLSMKYGDGSIFQAKTLDSQGNPLANQDVTFNVNGVFYNKTTDSNGVANLAINLMPGEYIITSIWNDFQIGNKIEINGN